MNEHITGRMDLMWNTENSRKVALAEEDTWRQSTEHTGKQKLSFGMAMILGALLTIEIMIGGAMILNFDFKWERISLLLCSHSWYYTLQWLPH